jgi:hypothetical protein
VTITVSQSSTRQNALSFTETAGSWDMIDQAMIGRRSRFKGGVKEFNGRQKDTILIDNGHA